LELRVVKRDEEKKRLLLELGGESYTLSNLLRKELWSDRSVREAAHIKEHPYLAQPKVFVAVSRGEPENALKRASKRLIKQVREFKERFRAALK
jgi:DNA-directed RNA polymerase subunit L